MKHNVLPRKFNFLVLLLLISHAAISQQPGKITGKVLDTKTGESLIGLTVKITGGTSGASTDVDGRYTLGNLNPGKYSLTFSYIGYQSKNITDIEVTAGKTTNLDVTLGEAASQALQEVVITATLRQESVNALYAQQKNSASISDGISSETIRRSPDKNTSDVLKRVSGATIQDNKFVVVRGLSDRYNSAQLDNSVLPSTEPNRKAFSFDIVPSNLIDNIVISKTATPDLPGDFAGGSVKIITKDIPDDNFISINIGSGYNTQSAFKDFKSGIRNTSDYFGFDDGTRGLKSGFPSTLKVINGLPAANNLAAIKKLNMNYTVQNASALPTQSYQFTMGRVKDFEKSGNRLGVLGSLTYRNSQQITPNLQRQYFAYDFSENQYNFSTNVGGIVNFAYKFGNNNITFKNIYNRIFDDKYTERTGTNAVTSTDNKFYAFDLIEKSVLKSTVEGTHKLGKNNSSLRWNASYSNVVNNQPDQRKTNYSKNISDRNNPAVNYSANVTSIGKENTRLFSDLNENIYSAEIGYTLPMTMFKKSSTFKLGVIPQYRQRDFGVRFLGLLLDNNAPNFNAIRERPISKLFGKDVVNAGYYKLNELPNLADRYSADSYTNSAYAMLDNKIGEKSRVVWGLRVEKFDLNLASKDPSQDEVVLDNFDPLPSVNYTYSITPKANFRLSYYRTLARPEFREIAPFAYYDYELLATQRGNPDLQRSLIDNADIRYEFYPSAGQIFSVSGFYKKFKNAIESFIDDQNSTPDFSYFNANKATVYGVELEIRKSLGFLSSEALANTTFYMNLSLIKSKVEDPTLAVSRSLVGQSPYVINAGLTQSVMQNKLVFNALYNRIGRRIFKANGQVFGSIYENSRDVVDLQASYKVMKNKGEIKLNAGDILNQSTLFYFDNKAIQSDNDGKTTYKKGQDEIFSRYKAGSNISLSFNYTF